MRLTLIALVVCGCVTHGLAFAEPVRVSLEWVELDCSECQELCARVFPVKGQIAVTSRDAPGFAELEKKAPKTVLVSHVEHLEPGSLAKHTTRINKTAFHLELGLRPQKNGAYETVINARQTQGEDLSELQSGEVDPMRWTTKRVV